MPITASAVIGGVTGGVQLATGIIGERKGREELDRLKKPFYKIQDEYIKNRDLAEIGAGQGLPSATTDFLTKESEKGFGTGVRGILESGGSPNDIAKLFDTFQTSVDKRAAEDAEARINNIKYFMDVNKDLAGQKNIQFGVNELQPYESALKSIQDRREAAKQDIFGGASTITGSLAAFGTSQMNNKLLRAFTAKGGTSNTEDPRASLFNSIFTELPDIRTTTPNANPASRELTPKPLNLTGTTASSNWWDSLDESEISQFLQGG